MDDKNQITVVRQDQCRRWGGGEKVLVEAYLGHEPGLQDDPEGLLDLIYNEIFLRTNQGDSPQLAEYQHRFPQFDSQLKLLFDVHQVVEGGALSAEVPGPDQSNNCQAADRPREGSTLAGFKIVRELGRGGMGVVYLARQLGLKRFVALKMILAGPYAGERERARFRAEAEAVARLQHSNIVQIYEIGEDEGHPFLVLEYVEGDHLGKQVAGTPQAPAEAAHLVETLARAMHYAHQCGIVHRDLKPANVLLAQASARFSKSLSQSNDEDFSKAKSSLREVGVRWVPKITDFGLAKSLDNNEEETRSGAIVGTPQYMAPEQASGKVREIGPSVDVYALGAILYEMLTGRPPFQGATAMDTLDQVRSQNPVPPARLQPKIPRDLETICLKCLEKEPRGRYPSALELADDLHRFLAGEPIQARPLSLGERLWKWTKRRPAAAALVAVTSVIALGLVMAVSGSLIYERQRLLVLRAKAQDLLFTSQNALTLGNWPEAKSLLSQTLTIAGTEDSLADLRGHAAEMLAVADSRLAEQTARQNANDKYRRFTEHRDSAMFYGMDSLAQGSLFTGLDRAANLRTTANAAREALVLAGVPIDADANWAPDYWLSASRQAEVRSDVYTLLLLLAEVSADQPDSGPASAQRCRQALQLLDRASGLGPPTQAYYQRRAHYLEQLGKPEEAQKVRAQATAFRPVSALDFFLIGHQQFTRGEFEQAITSFDNALALEPRHFWAQLNLAICYLGKQEWTSAKAGLTACLSRRPDFVWTYLLRGYANNQLNAFMAAETDFRNARLALNRSPNTEADYVLAVNRGVLQMRQLDAPAPGIARHLARLCSNQIQSEIAGLVIRVEHEKRLARAAVDFEEAIRLQPDQYAAHLGLVKVFQKQKKVDEAARQLGALIRNAVKDFMRPLLPPIPGVFAFLSVREIEAWDRPKVFCPDSGGGSALVSVPFGYSCP